MLRVSATTLEAYRRVCCTEYGDEAELVAQVKREPFTPRWQMEAGSAWHACLEGKGTPWYKMPNTMQSSGKYYFATLDIDRARALNGLGIWEVKAVSELLPGVRVVAQADHLDGAVIADNKTCFSPIDVKNYEPSLQWRLYLLVHNCRKFLYHCWDFKDPDGGGFCELKNVQTFSFWPYTGMEADCRRWLQQFLAWADGKKLIGYLEREGTEVAA